MSAFESKDAYRDFIRTVQARRRFIFDGKAGNFLAAARAACRSRAQTVKAGKVFYRAQVGSKFAARSDMGIEEERPFPKARMIPKPRFVKDGGRANPAGFAYLYLASTERTALAEMRPWVAESLTLATFKIKREIKLVVCQAGVEDIMDRFFDESPSPDKLDEYVWNDISTAFARPVSREDQEIAYLPTQILAEAFKAERFDGLAYRSSLERGTNVVLFNVRVAKLIDRFVYSLKKVRYDFEAVPNCGIYREKDGVGRCIMEIHTESP